MGPTLRLSDIMAAQVETVEPSESAEKAWHLMCQHGIHHLVVTRDGTVLGILSARDLAGHHGETFRAGRKVVELMIQDVTTAKPHTTVRQAAFLMRGRSIGCLPVVANKKLVGILTTSDLLELIAHGVERSIRRIHRGPSPLHII